MNYYDRTSEGYDALHEEEQLGKLRIIDREATITGLILMLELARVSLRNILRKRKTSYFS